MITIFTIPKPFKGHINTIQRNAIQSWMQLKPECEIILFGDDYGVSDIAKEFGLSHIPVIEKNRYGTPLLSSTFDLAQKHSKNETLVFANADIIFFQDLIKTINSIKISPYLISGRRYNFKVEDEIDFQKVNNLFDLQSDLKQDGELYNFSGKDYFIFKKGTVQMRPFAVGRVFWDDWFLFHMRTNNIPIINATNSINVIHQNHDYSHSKYGKKTMVWGPEMDYNKIILGHSTNILSLRDADFVIVDKLIIRPKLLYRIHNLLSYYYLWRLLMSIKSKLARYIMSRK